MKDNKDNLNFRNDYDRQHFDDVIKKGGFVQLEVSGRNLGEYRHVLFTPYQSYSGELYSTDIYKKTPDRNSGIEVGIYSGRFLRVERVIGEMTIVNPLRVSQNYIDREKQAKGKPAVIDFLEKQDVWGR